MAYVIDRACETCGGDGIVTSTYPPGSVNCWRCGGTGREIISSVADAQADVTTIKNGVSNLQVSIGGISSDISSLGDVCKQTLEVVSKILEIVGK